MTTGKLLYYMNMRDHDAIVDVDAFGNITRHTAEEFPSEEEFRRIKTWSDDDYRRSYLADRQEEYYSVSINDISEEAVSEKSVEIQIVNLEIEDERRDLCSKVLNLCNTVLTKKQRERFLLSIYGYSVNEICEILGLTHQSVSESLLSARATIRKFLCAEYKYCKYSVNKPCETPDFLGVSGRTKSSIV